MLPLAFFIGKVYSIMATFSINIPNNKTGLVVAAYNSLYNYQPIIANPNFDPQLPEDPETNPSTTGNPEGEYQHLQRQVRSWIIANVQSYEVKASGAAGRQAAIDNFDLNIT